MDSGETWHMDCVQPQGEWIKTLGLRIRIGIRIGTDGTNRAAGGVRSSSRVPVCLVWSERRGSAGLGTLGVIVNRKLEFRPQHARTLERCQQWRHAASVGLQSLQGRPTASSQRVSGAVGLSQTADVWRAPAALIPIRSPQLPPRPHTQLQTLLRISIWLPGAAGASC